MWLHYFTTSLALTFILPQLALAAAVSNVQSLSSAAESVESLPAWDRKRNADEFDGRVPRQPRDVDHRREDRVDDSSLVGGPHGEPVSRSDSHENDIETDIDDSLLMPSSRVSINAFTKSR